MHIPENTPIKKVFIFQYLLSKYPNAEWYVVVNDDHYVVPANLQYFVSNLNPQKLHAFSNFVEFSECINGAHSIAEKYQSTVNNAKSIILVSKAAVQSIVSSNRRPDNQNCPNDDDFLLALRLKHHGIKLQKIEEFLNVPLSIDFVACIC